MADFAEMLRGLAAARPALEARAIREREEERRDVQERAAHQLLALRSGLLLELTDEQLDGRAPLPPTVAGVWERLFPDRPVVDGHLATPAQMQRLQELRERRELVQWLVSTGRTVDEARAAVAAEYGDRGPAVAETRVVGDLASQDRFLKAAAQQQEQILGMLGLLPDPDPRGDVAALSDIDYVECFREAGFSTRAAEEGARQVAVQQKAGSYIGFGVAVSALKAFGGYTLSIRPHLSEAVVERVEAEEKARRISSTPAGGPGRLIQESAAPLDPATVTAAGGTPVPVVLLTPGWGSSGHYSPQVLEQAARDRVIPAGTHMYMDHPSQSDRKNRPERSVRDLVGVLTEDAHWNGRQLVSEAQFFPPYDVQLREMAGAIGLSIIGSATDVQNGTVEGRSGPIIGGLARVDSVDVVTRAGRGGRIVA